MAENNHYEPGNPALNGTDQLVALSGCSGGGKSSLLLELSAREYPVRSEPGRQVVKEQQFLGGSAVPWQDINMFIRLTMSRAIYLYNTAQRGSKPTIFDRTILDCAAWYHAHAPALPNDVKEAVARYRYSRTVFMVPPWKQLFGTDPERQHTFSDAVAEFDYLVPFYERSGYQIVLIPHASIAERADFLEAQLSRVGE